MRGARPAAIFIGVVAAALTLIPATASAQTIAVIGRAHPPWLKDIRHELEAAGFSATGDLAASDERWALRLTAPPERLEVIQRVAGGGEWIVAESVVVGRSAAARRRAIVRAVEILRARRTAGPPGGAIATTAAAARPGTFVAVAPPAPGAIAVSSTAATVPPPIRPPPMAATPAPRAVRPEATVVASTLEPPSPARAPIAAPAPTIEIARLAPAPQTSVAARPLSVGIVGGAAGAQGGIGAAPTVGVSARWTGRHAAGWTRGETGLAATSLSGPEGSAEARALLLSLGAGWLPRASAGARFMPVVGAEATGLFIRASSQQTAPGFRGLTVIVPGLSLAAVGGARFVLTEHLAADLQASVGIVASEPIVGFAGRRAAAWTGAWLSMSGALSWRF